MARGPATGSPAAMHRIELGLKFAIEPVGLKSLRQHPTLKNLRLAKPVTRPLKTVYFDTPDHHLHDQGIIVKVSSAGRRHLQSVKCAGAGPAGSALMVRDAFEDAIADDRPDLRLLTGTPLGALSADPDLAAGLGPIFLSDIRRSSYRLGEPGWAVELVLDEGVIADATNPERHLPVTEIELRMLEGTPDRLYLVALSFLDRVRLKPMLPPKSARGFALIAAGAGDGDGTVEPAIEKAATVALAGDMTAAEGFRCIARACLGQLAANEAAVRAGRPEGLHQMRVAVRRLKSALSTFRDIFPAARDTTIADPLAAGCDPVLLTPADIKTALGWLMDILGPARDADVFVDETLAGAEKLLGAEPLADLRAAVEDDRRAAWAAVARGLDDPRFARLPLVLGAWIEAGHWLAEAGVPAMPFGGIVAHQQADTDTGAAEAPEGDGQPVDTVSQPGAQPLGDFAVAVLDKRLKKVRHKGRGLGHLEPDARHEVRIQVKKLRYACEFFESLADKRKQATTFAKKLKALQDGLGALNDIAVARDRLDDLATRPGLGFPAGMIAGAHAATAADELADAVAAWKSFHKTAEPFWS